MNVLYEESGEFKVGTLLAEGDASLQVEAAHGKRTKVKAANVLLRFPEPLAGFLERAAALAGEIDTDFLWACCGEDEFDYADLAAEYCGRTPTPIESASILVKLQSAPIHFHRKGRGRFRAAPEETVKAALAGLERKRQQALQMDVWAAQLARGELPDSFRTLLPQLLYKPDRNRAETKAFERACADTGLSPARLAERCGALPSSHDYHFNRFLFEQFPQGAGFPEVTVPDVPKDLPQADVAAFSLDDAATTEIDDAFSVTRLGDGGWRVGVHIAAPGLGFAPGSAIDAIARARLSTAYMPGTKITMLPPAVIERFTLAGGAARPAVSLYLDLDPASLAVRAQTTRIERVPIAANIRHHEVEALNETIAANGAAGIGAGPFSAALQLLWQFARELEAGRGKAANTIDRVEYAFEVEDDRIAITPRKRGAPMDKLVAELMILVNRTWGRLLDEHGAAAIYRAQAQGKVRMTTVAAEHQGLGVAHYAWSSSPLRRYVDLVNQWQLLAVLRDETPPFGKNSAELLAAVRDFEVTYAAYDEFQRQMEQYWCLRWLVQEGIRLAPAEVMRENLVRFADVPLHVRVPSLPELAPGTQVILEVERVDLIDSQVVCVYKKAQQNQEAA